MRKTILGILICLITVYSKLYTPNSSQFTYHGRYYFESGALKYDWTCFKIDFCFQGSTKIVWNLVDTWNIYHAVFDQNTTKVIHPKKEKQITLFQSSNPQSHCIELIKITQNHYGPIASYKDSIFNGIDVTNGTLIKKIKKYQYRFDFVGDSLTTAFGVMGSKQSLAICIFKMKSIQNCRQSWATHLSNTFNADYRIEAISGKGVMRNSLAIFGKPMPTKFTRVSDNSAPFTYHFQDGYRPDILFICLGVNDFSNIKDPSQNNFLNAYRDMIQMILNQQIRYLGTSTKIVSVCPIGFIKEVCILVKRAVQQYHYAYKWIYYLEVPENAFDLKKDMGCDGHPNYIGQRKFAKSLQAKVKQILQERD